MQPSTEETMSHVTFDASLGRQTAVKTSLGATVRQKIELVRNRLKDLVTTPIEDIGEPRGPLSNYYTDACDRTKAATPVTSLRDISGS